MIICGLCERQTKPGETTGKFYTMVYRDPKDRSQGKRIYKEKKVCMNCSGKCLLK